MGTACTVVLRDPGSSIPSSSLPNVFDPTRPSDAVERRTQPLPSASSTQHGTARHHTTRRYNTARHNTTRHATEQHTLNPSESLYCSFPFNSTRDQSHWIAVLDFPPLERLPSIQQGPRPFQRQPRSSVVPLPSAGHRKALQLPRRPRRELAAGSERNDGVEFCNGDIASTEEYLDLCL